MPNPSTTSLTFYPSYCFPLSPTYDTWVRLTASDVHSLRERAGYEGQNLYFHLNHPIRWIRLVGIIVAVDVYPKRWIMLLDDSSGVNIELTCGREAPSASAVEVAAPPTNGKGAADASASATETKQTGLTATGRTVDLSGIDVGTVVKVKGGINVFRREKQVILERISILHSTNEEMASWAETTTFRHEILNTPWTISHKDEERAKRKAANEEREKKLRAELRRRKRKQIENNRRLENERGKGGNGEAGRKASERKREKSRRDTEK